jgi:hypothetical protein
MKKGEKEFFKHFVILAILVSCIVILATFHIAPAWLMQILTVATFVYLFLYMIGIFFHAGPFNYINKLYVQDAEVERENMRSKQPWE